jgi:hypothetical protein
MLMLTRRTVCVLCVCAAAMLSLRGRAQDAVSPTEPPPPLVPGAPPLESATAEVEKQAPAPAALIDAKNLHVDRKTQMAYGEGDVLLRYKDLVLRADKAKYNIATDEVWAEGHVRLNRDNQEWVMPSLYYHLKTRAMKTDVARGVFDELTLRGSNVRMTGSNRYEFVKGTVTTCDYEDPHYRLQAVHGEIYPGDRVVLYNVTMRIGNVPVFWFPIIVWSLKERSSPVAIAVGQSSRNGTYILTWTRMSVDAHMTAAMRVDERSRRGPGGGPELEYYYNNAQGVARMYYSRDENPIDEIDRYLHKNIPHNRYRAEWMHKQQLPDDVDVTVNVIKQSDTDFLDDFNRCILQQEGEPASVVDVTKRGENYTLSALARPQLNPFFAEVERLPEARWAVNRVRIGETPVFYEGETSAGYYHNTPGRTNEPSFMGSSTRADTFHQLVVPQQYFGWLSVVPHVGIRGTYYGNAADAVGPSNEVRRVMLDVGAEASFKLTRTWDDVENKKWNIHGLRHIVEPFIGYQWVPSPNNSADKLPQFDSYRYVTLLNGSPLLLTRYSPLDFPANTAIDALGRQNVTRFGVRQKLQTRRNGVPWDLVALETWTDYSFEKTPMIRDFSDAFMTMRIFPTTWWAMDIGGRYGIHEKSMREFNTGTTVYDRDRWRLSLMTRYLEGDSDIVYGLASYRLDRHWTATMIQSVDMQDGQWLEQDYMLQQELHDWTVNYGFRLTGQRIGSDETLFFVSISLKAYPSVSVGTH